MTASRQSNDDAQSDLFGVRPVLPEGFRYEPEVITPAEEQSLLSQVRELPLNPFEFRGYEGKRRVTSFGWRYDFEQQSLEPTDEIPRFLLPLRETAARFARLDPAELQQALITEYEAGAAIGWHRDRGVFGDVVGISLAASCLFRLRRKVGDRWDRASITADPRSAYLISGPARTVWEHSIPPVEELRYSITFRTLRRSRSE